MHKVIEKNLEAYLDGSLLPVRGRELDAHLEDCPGCRQELAEMRQTREWMQALVSKQMVAPSPGFYARVLARVETQAGQVVWPFWQLFPAYGRQVSFALVTLLLLLSTFFISAWQTERRAISAELLPGVLATRPGVPALTEDTRTNRESVMLTLISVEGD